MASWEAHAHVCEHALPLFLFTNLVWCSWNTSLSGTLNWQRTWIINHFISTNKIRCVLAIQAKYVNTYWTCTNLKYRNHPNIMALYYGGRVRYSMSKILHRKCCPTYPVTLRSQKSIFQRHLQKQLVNLTSRRPGVFSRAQQPSSPAEFCHLSQRTIDRWMLAACWAICRQFLLLQVIYYSVFSISSVGKPAGFLLGSGIESIHGAENETRLLS